MSEPPGQPPGQPSGRKPGSQGGSQGGGQGGSLGGSQGGSQGGGQGGRQGGGQGGRQGGGQGGRQGGGKVSQGGRLNRGWKARPELASRFVRRLVHGMEVGPVLQVLAAWPRVAGVLVSEHLQAVRFSAGTLFVKSDQSVWSHQLTFLRPELLRKYEIELGKPIVQDIRLTTSAPAAPGLAAAPPPGASRPARDREEGATAGRRAQPFAALPREELAAIEARASEQIKDPELAKRWAKLEARIKSAQLARKLAGEQACEKCGVRHPGKGRLCPICDIEGKPPIVPGLLPPK